MVYQEKRQLLLDKKCYLRYYQHEIPEYLLKYNCTD